MLNLSCSNERRIPHLTFLLILSDSACANHENIVSNTSSDCSRVLMFSFSNMTAMPSALSSRTYCKLSTVFRANRLTDLARIMSMLPRRQYCCRLSLPRYLTQSIVMSSDCSAPFVNFVTSAVTISQTVSAMPFAPEGAG